MDTTDAYIDMRLAAIPELGRGATPSGLFNGAAANRVWVDTKGSFYVKDGPIQCQLERQDQLRAMNGLTWLQFDRRCACMASEVYQGQPVEMEPLPSKEVAGISVVMLDKHGKTWDGKEWQ